MAVRCGAVRVCVRECVYALVQLVKNVHEMIITHTHTFKWGWGCFCLQPAAHCRDNAKRRAVDFLASESEKEKIPGDEVFFLAVTSYALSFSKRGRQSMTRLFAHGRNDCKPPLV